MSGENYTVKQLQERLTSLGIQYTSRCRKNDLRKLLEAELPTFNKIGIHVFKNGNMEDSITNTRNELNINSVQIFTHGPRSFNKSNMCYTDIVKACDGINVYVHSAYPTNPWKGDAESMDMTIEQFVSSHLINSKGVVLHIPKLNPDDVVKPIPELVVKLKKAKIMEGQKVILEMKAVKTHPTMSYETPEKINRLVRKLESVGLKHTEVGICIDTAHIYAGKAQITTYQEAENYCNLIEKPEWICLLHLNGNEYDAKKRAGDKHAIPLNNYDMIWKSLSYKESGCKAFIQYAHKLNIDIILEVKDHHTSNQINSFLNSAKIDL
jgi:endonuclease IV